MLYVVSNYAISCHIMISLGGALPQPGEEADGPAARRADGGDINNDTTNNTTNNNANHRTHDNTNTQNT